VALSLNRVFSIAAVVKYVTVTEAWSCYPQFRRLGFANIDYVMCASVLVVVTLWRWLCFCMVWFNRQGPRRGQEDSMRYLLTKVPAFSQVPYALNATFWGKVPMKNEAP